MFRLSTKSKAPLALGLALATSAGAAEKSADVVIYEATPAGVAVAIAAERGGAETLLLEPGQHPGGRLSETLGFDEQNRMKPETVGG